MAVTDVEDDGEGLFQISIISRILVWRSDVLLFFTF